MIIYLFNVDDHSFSMKVFYLRIKSGHMKFWNLRSSGLDCRHSNYNFSLWWQFAPFL